MRIFYWIAKYTVHCNKNAGFNLEQSMKQTGKIRDISNEAQSQIHENLKLHLKHTERNEK